MVHTLGALGRASYPFPNTFLVRFHSFLDTCVFVTLHSLMGLPSCLVQLLYTVVGFTVCPVTTVCLSKSSIELLLCHVDCERTLQNKPTLLSCVLLSGETLRLCAPMSHAGRCDVTLGRRRVCEKPDRSRALVPERSVIAGSLS